MFPALASARPTGRAIPFLVPNPAPTIRLRVLSLGAGDEARRFLRLPQPTPDDERRERRPAKAPTGTPEAARRLWAASKPIAHSIAQRYLARRGITDLRGCEALRFHPRCYYRASGDDAFGVRPAWPAMIAAVTDLDGAVAGVHRSWIDPDAVDKAPVAYPRRAMGHLLGNGVRFGTAGPVMVAGEGIETVLSLRTIMPVLPMIAGLSASHLAAILFPPALQRLYVARDDDPAGTGALATLTRRAGSIGIEVLPLEPRLGDFNDDLRFLGPTVWRLLSGYSSSRRMLRIFSPAGDRPEGGVVSGQPDWFGRPVSASGSRRTSAFEEGDRAAGGAGPQWRVARLFSAGPGGPLHREAK